MNVTKLMDSNLLLLATAIFAALWVAHAKPPAPVVECVGGDYTNCTVSNIYGVWNDRTPCRAAAVVYPSTEEELLAVVASATRRRQKMKAVTRWSSSIPKWACPGGEAGLLISTLNYTTRGVQLLGKDNLGRELVTVDSGVPLLQLIHALSAKGFSLTHSPYWGGVTVGGLLSTGSHGSSLIARGGALHDYVVAMTLVIPATKQEGYAKLIQLTENDEALNATKVSLGVLGVISQVTFIVESIFERSITNVIEDDTLLEEKIIQLPQMYEFGDIAWHPSQQKVMYKMDKRVLTRGNGINDFIGFQAQNPITLNVVRDTELLFEKTRNRLGKCVVAKAQASLLNTIGFGLKNDGKRFIGYPVIGSQDKLQTSGSCLNASKDDVCGWDPRVNGLFFYESAFLIKLANIVDFIKDVKKLRDNDPSRFCGTDLYYGFLLRYVKKSSAYLGAIEDSVEVNFNYFRQRIGGKARLDEDIWEEIEQIARYKYNGLPSWGKNREAVFMNVDMLYQERMYKFIKVMNTLDPLGLFSSEWSDYVLKRRQSYNAMNIKSNHFFVPSRIFPSTCNNPSFDKGGKIVASSSLGSLLEVNATSTQMCAIEGTCFCMNDEHCSPSEGYRCRNGIVYQDAHVCRYEPSI